MNVPRTEYHDRSRTQQLSRDRWRNVLAPALCAIWCVLATISSPQRTLAQPAQAAKAISAGRAVYDDDRLFEQLSGAARNRAERKFGKKRLSTLNSSTLKSQTFSPSSGGEQLAPGGFSPIPNVLVNDPTLDTTSLDTQSETTLTLASGSTVVSSYNDSAQAASGKYTGFSQSTNGGASWIDKGGLPNNSDGDAGDPILAFSRKTGTIVLGTLSFNSEEKLLIFRSTNNGASFSGPVNGAPGFTAANGSQDKEWIAVDNFPGTGYGNFYMFWRNFASPGGMTFTKSTDDGLTWGPSGGLVLLSNSGQGAQVAVGADHAVYVFWYDSSATPRRIRMRKSTDLGASFGSTTTVTTLVGRGVNGDLNLGGFRSSSFPQVVVNPVSGNLYIIYPDVTALSGGDRGNIYFRQSSNGGTSWSAAVKVNDDNTTRAQFQPAIAVKPDGSSLAISWYDRRRDPFDALIERWGVTATISGNTVAFGPNFRISPQFPAVFGVDPLINPTYMGDYDQMAADTNFFYTSWGDNRIRFAKFGVEGTGPVVDVDSVTVTGGNGNGLVDPNECNTLKVVLRNNGTGPASNLLATLTTTTPRVSVLQAYSTYPDLAPGALGTNAATLAISTLPSFVCGTAVGLTLNVVYPGATNPSSFTPPSGGASYVIMRTNGASIVPGSTDTGNHGDDVTTAITLPFAYTFYGQTFSNASVSANGNLQFSSADGDFVNVCLPSSGFNNAIFPFWTDLETDGNLGPAQGIYTSVSGSGPNRIFNIEWRASYFDSSKNGSPVNFEIRLYEGQSRFDLVYGTLNGTGTDATVGVQRDTGSSYTNFECNAGGLSSGLQLTFQPEACVDGGGLCAGPFASFTASPRAGRAPLAVAFTNFSFGATNYSWTFGDTQTSSATNPVHSYTNGGSFTVSLTSIGPGGTDTLALANYVVVTNPIPPVANFVGVPPSGTPPLTVSFVNLSTQATNYSWDLGDGATSTAVNPVHVYPNPGAYTVRLTAIGPDGTNTLTRPDYISVTPIATAGDNSSGQISVPVEAVRAVALAAGAWNSLALRASGVVVAWGNDFNGQIDVPTNLTDAVAIAAGSYHCLAIRANGTLVAWGADDYGQTSVPSGLASVIAIAAGAWHSLALKADGTLVAWGDDSLGQTDVPPDLVNVVAIAAGGGHSLALKGDGTVVAWGDNTDAGGSFVGQSVVPDGLANVAAFAAGDYHSLAVKNDGTVVAWGDNSQHQSSPPADLTGVVAVAAGRAHSLALKADGTVAAWGANLNGQCDLPPALTNAVAIAAGAYHTLVLVDDGAFVPRLFSPGWTDGQFQVLLQTLNRKNYGFEYRNSFTAGNWTGVSNVAGNGALRLLRDPAASGSQRFYRVRQF
ncbi:MAG: hypothetical protein DME25_12055 [Verrucomicrobia bacterium]|nr:MAG: hypothetical protein DME25_12055 [Verrucomicrobiota bacterium]